MKNPFKKPKKAASKAGPQLMKVYLKDYRVGGIMTHIVQPGLKHPEVAEWRDLIPIPFNSPAAMSNDTRVVRTRTGQPAVLDVKTFKVVFRDGMAEVEQRLATFMIGENLCFAKKQKPCNWTAPRLYSPAEAEA
jgi:hypothetical protein